MSGRKSGLLMMWLLAVVVYLSLGGAVHAQGPSDPKQEVSSVPVLAYYYIRYGADAWDRARTDYPLLGPYSSNDLQVMQRHVEWAKAAGIDGFIVSWKSKDTLNERLELLIQACEEVGFKLAIIYQGLDYGRNPRLIERVGADMTYFAEHYATRPVFGLFERPLIIWNGIWEYSRDDVARVTSALRDRLLILASERSGEDYLRVADLVDGNAYYWSSVDPDGSSQYPQKLMSLEEVIHAHGGLWIAPAAPGYDSTLIGGEKVVGRQEGQMLRRQMAAALQSSPDAVGLISWNEFSESTYVEPSENYGTHYLEVLAEILDITSAGDPPLGLTVRPFDVKVRTVPPLPEVAFSMNGQTVLTNQSGVAWLQVPKVGTYRLETVLPGGEPSGCRTEFSRWQANVFVPNVSIHVPRKTPVQAGFEHVCPVDLAFVDAAGRPVDPRRIDSVTLINTAGFRRTLHAFQAQRLRATRVVHRLGGLEVVGLGYTVESVWVDGSSVVNRGQQSFYPAENRDWQIELLLYSARFTARDALFGSPVGKRIRLQYPNGETKEWSLAPDGEVTVEALARGLYRATVEGAAGFALSAPIALSQDQDVKLLVISYLDMAAAALLGMAFVAAPVLVGRPRARSALRRRAERWLRLRS